MACNLVELCVKERRVSRISVLESERDEPSDGMRARARRPPSGGEDLQTELGR